MRTLIAILALAAPWGVAHAHLLPADAGIARQLGHQLAGAHHIPLLVVVAWLVILGLRAAVARRRALQTDVRRDQY